MESWTTQDKNEFFQWYIRNEAHLRDYTFHELARVAHSCGFRIGDMGSALNEWLDAAKRRAKFWESPFCIKWMRLWMYEKGRDADEEKQEQPTHRRKKCGNLSGD